MGAERRKNLRVNLEVEVDVSTPNNFYAGRTRDLSTGGLFIEMPVTPEPGTDVSIKLTLGRRVFNLNCRVAWVLQERGGAGAGFGAEFTSLPPGVKRAIEAFADKRDPEVFDLLDDVEMEDEDEDELATVKVVAPSPPPLPVPAAGFVPPPLPAARNAAPPPFPGK